KVLKKIYPGELYISPLLNNASNGDGFRKKLPLREIFSHNFSNNSFAFLGPPICKPYAHTTVLIAPALVPDIASTSISSTSNNLSNTPQVNAPCAPPPCKANVIFFISFVFLSDIANYFCLK